jgi:hypothetical protein
MHRNLNQTHNTRLFKKKMPKLLDFAKMGRTQQDSRNKNEVQGKKIEALIYFLGGKGYKKLLKNERV